MSLEVSRAEAEHWRIVKDLRLRALAESPAAFGSTWAREVALDDEDWRQRVGEGDWFLAWHQGRAVGVSAGVTAPGQPDGRHLVALWVEAEHRGAGAATALVQAVCDWARSEGASEVTLWVSVANPRARSCFERAGFAPTGGRRPMESDPSVAREELVRALA